MTKIVSQFVNRLLLVTLFASPPLASAQVDPNADIYGKWKIKAMIGGGAASALTQRDVDKLIGKYVIISPEKFAFNGRTCTHPNYQRTKEETVQFFDQAWRADVSDIPFPNPVTVVETGCNTLFPIRKNHLMIAEENVFLEAVRDNAGLRKASPQRQR
ncbi:MAG: hypothetical protein QFF03_23245 [Pseudomonadota bacterium]|nr:hypothetical protein [Pseudomonadota bacterium]